MKPNLDCKNVKEIKSRDSTGKVGQFYFINSVSAIAVENSEVQLPLLYARKCSACVLVIWCLTNIWVWCKALLIGGVLIPAASG